MRGWQKPTRAMIAALRWTAHWGGNVYPDAYMNMWNQPDSKGHKAPFMPSSFLRLVISGHMARNSAGGLGITELGFTLVADTDP